LLAGKTKQLWKGQAAVRRVSAATPVAAGKAEDDHPAAGYGPDGTLWVAYISYTLRDESRRVEQKSFKEQPANFKALYTPEFGDQLFVKYYRGGKWSRPAAVTGPREDLVRCAIAAEGGGKVWVVYSANRKGNFDIYARALDLSAAEGVSHPQPRMGGEQRLTKNPGPDLNPVMCTDQAGDIHLAFQSWDETGLARIGVLNCRRGKWGEGPTYLEQP